MVNLNGGLITCSRVGSATANASASATGDTATFNFNGGTLKASAASATFYQGSTGSPTVPITSIVQSGGAIINDGGFAISVLEVLQHYSALGSTNDGGLTKLGAGTLTLTRANTYTGPTIISNGSLALGNGGSISDSVNINILAGANLNTSAITTLTLASGQTLEGGGSITGALTSSAGSTVAPGSSGATGTLTASGAVTLNGTTCMKLNSSASTNDVVAGSSITYGGTLNLTNLSGTLTAGKSFKLFNATTYNGSFTNLTPVIPGLGLGWATPSLSTSGTLSVIAQPTPRPHFAGIVASGTNLVMSGTNGVPYWTYYVLTSTNVSLPVSNWTVVATNAFGGSGNFSFTNSPHAPQTFYQLQLQ
jgi:autotransporter-associated beta strand protein